MMNQHSMLNSVFCAVLMVSTYALGANQSWDSGGADSNWTTAANWGGANPDTVPVSDDNATIADGGTALYSAASGTNSVYKTHIGGGSTLNIIGGKLSNTQSGSTMRNNVGSGSAGTVNQSGGTHVVGHMLRVGNGSGGNGAYYLSGGDLQISRGANSGVADSTSIDIGVSGGTGLFEISGGSLETRIGVGIGANGTFRVKGGGATSISIGSYGTYDGGWEQDPGGTLSVAVDTNGLTPIFIDYVDGVGYRNADVLFHSGSLLDAGFVGDLNTFGVWDVMQWEGILWAADMVYVPGDGFQDVYGLEFAPGVDTNQWSFEFVDTTASGSLDTLRVKSVVLSDGTWSDAAGGDVSWTDLSSWSGGTVAYGAGQVAYFDKLNHVGGKNVDLTTDIVIGAIRYRDNGDVNRSIIFESANGSRLIMAGGSTPLIWARNRDITLDVVVDGTNGLQLASQQSGRSVILKQRNSWSGTTTILDESDYRGWIKTSYPGDFGRSDLVVKGDSGDSEAELIIDHGGVLDPSASLTLESGATVDLNFADGLDGEADIADLYVSALVLDGITQPAGVYNASTHPAWFSGDGEIVVQPVRDSLELKLKASRELEWASQSGNFYDVYDAASLVSNDWNFVETVDAAAPTNLYNVDAATNTARFYKVVERPDYVTTVRGGVISRLDDYITNNYLPDQNLNTASNRHGQFHSSDNMRMSECTPVLVWCYMQPDSIYYQDSEVLDRAIWSVDYLCRAQGINGGFNEYHGWCGVPDRTNGKSSVVGFTMHAIGNAIELMCRLPEMDVRLAEYMDPNGTGSDDTERRTAWKNMLYQAMPFQFSGNGRGHAPNQDLCALMGVYAINGAYAALDGGTLLKTQAEIDALSNEIYYGYPSAASSNPNGQWFSSSGMLGEHGKGGYGYDGNYGVKVCFRYLGVLAPLDSTSATFLSTKFADAMEYFFVTDESAPLGVYAENGIARRSTGDPMDPGIMPIACAAGYHDSLDRLYNIMLPHFAKAPAANVSFSSPSMFQIGVWGYCEWLDKISEPVYTDYRLPTERNEAFEFRDETMQLLVTKPAGGVPTYYTETWETEDKARRHITSKHTETVETEYEF